MLAIAPSRPLRVLLVDDVEDLRRLTRFALEMSGSFEVVAEAGDGADGVTLAGLHQPDVVLLDVSMPGMDGMEALPLIRDAAPGASVVMLSGFEQERLGASALERGAVAYLEKGLPPAQLAEQVQAAVGVRLQGDDLWGEPTPPALRDDELYAVVAHDLRGPLGAIIGFAATLESSWELVTEEQRRDMVRRMGRQARILRTVTDNLLASRALELGAVEVEADALDAAIFLLETANDLRPLAPSHEVVVVVAEGTRPVIADAGRLRQVLANLVGNAARYAPPGTTITLGARGDADGTIVSVSDEGPGIPPDARNHVFEKHVRLGPSQGLGLGLFLCAAFVRAMGGSIWIAERPVGTEVCVRLPSLGA